MTEYVNIDEKYIFSCVDFYNRTLSFPFYHPKIKFVAGSGLVCFSLSIESDNTRMVKNEVEINNALTPVDSFFE